MQFNVDTDLIPQMRACATHAFSAVTDKLNPMRRHCCFELFGLDFMVDERHKVQYMLVHRAHQWLMINLQLDNLPGHTCFAMSSLRR